MLRSIAAIMVAIAAASGVGCTKSFEEQFTDKLCGKTPAPSACQNGVLVARHTGSSPTIHAGELVVRSFNCGRDDTQSEPMLKVTLHVVNPDGTDVTVGQVLPTVAVVQTGSQGNLRLLDREQDGFGAPVTFRAAVPDQQDPTLLRYDDHADAIFIPISRLREPVTQITVGVGPALQSMPSILLLWSLSWPGPDYDQASLTPLDLANPNCGVFSTLIPKSP
jgi:hypothetical protein